MTRGRTEEASRVGPPEHGLGSQIKSRERVRDLAEVYTHRREVEAMLDLVPDMFPSVEEPSNTDRKFFEPACGSGNFLEEILARKIRYVTTARYGYGERFEHRLLRALASIYAIDINEENVAESKQRLRSSISSHLDYMLNTRSPSVGLLQAVEVILDTNLICGDALADRRSIRLIDYRAGRSATFTRVWSFLDVASNHDLLSRLGPTADEHPIHYSLLAANPDPVGTGTS